MRNKSNRNGTAAVRLPKNVSRPVSASRGYSVTGTAASANHPANRMKLIDNSLPVWGKLKDVGTITSGSASRRVIDKPMPLEQILACLNENRQDDEQIGRHKRGDQRVARRPEHLLIAKRGKRRDQSRQHPQATSNATTT